ncbi:hypothetical protein BSKO_00358 [Bryopsis sp. KO-2023]|nr:hypothetical protein BSKO_00358 [Bryopsis sp. KO-2023]
MQPRISPRYRRRWAWGKVLPRGLLLLAFIWLFIGSGQLRARYVATSPEGSVRLLENPIRPQTLRDGLKAGSKLGGNGEQAWRSAVRSAFSPDLLAGNVSDGYWHEYLTVSMTHVLTEIRKSGRIIQCNYDPALSSLPTDSKRIFIASNLHNNEEIMPNFITQLVQFLLAFPERRFFVSIYESGSTDRTGEWLELLKEVLSELKVSNRIVANGGDLRKEGQGRIEFLAGVRNRALEPLYDAEEGIWDKIVFINDVLFCSQDIIRLMQHDGDAVCGLDFIRTDLAAYPRDMLQDIMLLDLTDRFFFPETVAREISHNKWMLKRWKNSLGRRDAIKSDKPLVFYDIWVSHDLGGSQLDNFPPYIKNDTYSADRLRRGLPFQAQCCWNGMVVLNAKPFHEGLKFRAHLPNECATSECVLMCHDFARMGYKSVLIDPGVRSAYTFEDAMDLYSTRMVEQIPVTSWGDVLASEKLELVEVPENTKNFQCCPLREGMELVDWKDCFWYDIGATNYTMQSASISR